VHGIQVLRDALDGGTLGEGNVPLQVAESAAALAQRYIEFLKALRLASGIAAAGLEQRPGLLHPIPASVQKLYAVYSVVTGVSLAGLVKLQVSKFDFEFRFLERVVFLLDPRFKLLLAFLAMGPQVGTGYGYRNCCNPEDSDAWPPDELHSSHYNPGAETRLPFAPGFEAGGKLFKVLRMISSTFLLRSLKAF
jgi:hypothetical protein